MKKILLSILLLVVLAVASVLIYATTQPDQFHVERSLSMNAPADTVFNYIQDFHLWAKWSPYEKLDTAMITTFSGADKGLNAIYSWSGNSNAGSGSMEIIGCNPPSLVKIKLKFIEPFESESITEFALDSLNNQTNVTWTMSGDNSYMGKIMSVFFDMDEMIGKDFETGLNNLKVLSEQQ